MKFIFKKSKTFNRKISKFLFWSAFSLSIVFAIFVSTGTANAGLFSFLSPLVDGGTASAKERSYKRSSNTQTIALLQAATNIDPNPNKPVNIAPIADNTLIPDIASNNTTDIDQSSSQINIYTVRDGDTIAGIAKMFRVSVNTILWANDLTSKSVLKAGQNLIILPVSGIIYTVKKGDTVIGIAKKYSADVNDITAYNDLSVSALQVGQSIIIPDAEIPTIATKKPVAKSSRIVGNEPLLDKVSNSPAYPGYYIRPISGGRISQDLHGHNGVDFAASVGTPIVASAGGTVIISKMNGGWNGGYGNFVVISHANGTQSLYAHMQTKTVVEAGDKVKSGQIIGSIGMTGLTTGPHVHFEIRGAKNPF